MSNIESVLNERRVFEPSAEFVKQANVSGMAGDQSLCDAATQDYAGFWAKLARETLLWKKPFTKTLDQSNAPFFKWFEDGELNVSYNCLDRHLASQPPMGIEAVVAMQACARIGAIHSVVFGGFSAKSLHERITDAQACAVITADAQMRGGKVMPLKPIVDETLALGNCKSVHSVIVYRRAGNDVEWDDDLDIWWHDPLHPPPAHR